MTDIVKDDFEAPTIDVTTKWTGTNITTGESLALQASPHAGLQSLLAQTAGGPDQYATVRKSGLALPIAYASAYVRKNSGTLTVDDNRVNMLIYMSCANISITRVAGVEIFQLRVYNGGGATGWVTANSTITPQIGRWYKLELVWYKGDKAEFYIDGVLAGRVPLTGLASANSNIADARFGLAATTVAATPYSVSIDDALLADGVPQVGGGFNQTILLVGAGLAVAVFLIFAVFRKKK